MESSSDIEVALQSLARHTFIVKMQKEIMMDMVVCKLMRTDASEFPRMLKKEIDNIVTKCDEKKSK